MILSQKPKRLFSNRSSRSIYDSIDGLPIKIWFDVSDTNNLSLLAIEGLYNDAELKSVWIGLRQQHIDEFGLEEKKANNLRLQKELLKLEYDLIITGDNFIKNYINVTKAELTEETNVENLKFEDALVLLEKSYQIIIDPLKTSTKKFYYYLKNAA